MINMMWTQSLLATVYFGRVSLNHCEDALAALKSGTNAVTLLDRKFVVVAVKHNLVQASSLTGPPLYDLFVTLKEIHPI